MNFFRKIISFLRYYLYLTIYNKMSFVFTLLFPVVYQLISYKKVVSMDENRLMVNIIGMIAYIIVDTALNGVTEKILATRESGYIKAYYFASGSRWAIYWANLIVQLLIVILENIIFVIFSMLLYQSFSLKLLLILLGVTIIVFPFIALGFNFIFLLRMRNSSMSIFVTSLVLGLLVLFNVTFPNHVNFFTMLNPYVLIGVMIGEFSQPSLSILMSIGFVFIIYSAIGFIGYQFLDLQNRGKKN